VTTGPFHRRVGDEDALWLLGGLYRFKARGSETGGALTVVEVQGPAGFVIPVHQHEREEESFFVARGNVTFFVDREEHPSEAGSFAFVPRGIGHAFRFDSDDASLLLLLTPGGAGHEAMFAEMGEPADHHTIPSPPDPFPDPEDLAALAARHGTRIVGPPPGTD
jgi:quercetin dioxygenase-like cupin family protein